MHSDTNTSLEGTTNVVAVPGDTLRNVGVDTGADEESTKVLGTVGVDSGKDDETNHTAKNVSKMPTGNKHAKSGDLPTNLGSLA